MPGVRRDALRGGTPRYAASIALDFIHCGDAALAEVRVIFAFAYVGRIIPATRAFLTMRALDLDPQSVISTGGWLADVRIVCGDFNLRDDEKGRKAGGMLAQHPGQFTLSSKSNPRFKARGDGFRGA